MTVNQFDTKTNSRRQLTRVWGTIQSKMYGIDRQCGRSLDVRVKRYSIRHVTLPIDTYEFHLRIISSIKIVV